MAREATVRLIGALVGTVKLSGRLVSRPNPTALSDQFRLRQSYEKNAGVLRGAIMSVPNPVAPALA